MFDVKVGTQSKCCCRGLCYNRSSCSTSAFLQAALACQLGGAAGTVLPDKASIPPAPAAALLGPPAGARAHGLSPLLKLSDSW